MREFKLGERWFRAVVDAGSARPEADLGSVWTLSDLTEVREAQRLQLRLGTAIEQIGEGIIIVDPTPRIVYANRSMEKQHGYGPGELLGQPPQVLLHESALAEVGEQIRSRVEQGLSWTGRVANKKKDGTPCLQDLSVSPILDSQGRLVETVGVHRDVTREAALEAQLLQAQKMEAIGRLAGGIAHDFNNLLTVIIANIDFAAEGLAAGDPRLEDLREARKGGERAAALTRQLLLFSRKQVAERQDLDLNEVVRGVEKLLHRVIGEDVALEMRLAAGSARIRANAGQLEQVLMNLAVNARDAMSGGGLLSIATAKVDLDGDSCRGHKGMMPGSFVQLAVSDSGCGMSEEVLSRLFEPFFTTKEVGKGTGLGLAVVYGIVEQWGGAVEVSSRPGKGTTFRLLLPLLEGAAVQTPVVEVTKAPQGSETVLLVEDDADVRGLTRRVLAEAGYRVLTAPDPEAGLAAAGSHEGPIHLLLTDVVMPGSSGIELAGRFLELCPHSTVLFMSGYTDRGSMQGRALPAGAPFLQKPFTPLTLAHKVREVLDQASKDKPE